MFSFKICTPRTRQSPSARPPPVGRVRKHHCRHAIVRAVAEAESKPDQPPKRVIDMASVGGSGAAQGQPQACRRICTNCTPRSMLITLKLLSSVRCQPDRTVAYTITSRLRLAIAAEAHMSLQFVVESGCRQVVDRVLCTQEFARASSLALHCPWHAIIFTPGIKPMRSSIF